MTDLQLLAVSGDRSRPLPVPRGARDVHELFEGVPPGIYSALRTFGGHRFLRLPAHLDRCRRCVARAGWRTHFDYDGLCVTLDRAVREHGGRDVRVRFDLLEDPLPGGSAGEVVVLGVGPHEPVPALLLEQGARLALAPEGLGRPEPLVKYTEWVARRAVCKESDPDAYEWLLLDSERNVLEGTSSNFYVIRGRSLVTAGDGILEGITREVTLELAARAGLRLELRRLPVADLASCDEAFLTSSTRGVVPVTRVADTLIADGRVGAASRTLATEYEAYARENARAAV